MKSTLKLFIKMALLTANQMYLKCLLFTAAHRCNGMNDTSLCTKCNSLLDPVLLTTDHCHWNYKLFHVAWVVMQLVNRFLEILIKQIQWQASLLIFRGKMFQVNSITSQLAHFSILTMHWMFFQLIQFILLLFQKSFQTLDFFLQLQQTHVG